MTQLVVADEVCAVFPDLRIDVIVAEGFSGRPPWPEVDARLSALEADAAIGVPAGAFDLRQIVGDITVRFADGSEAFTPLGEPGTTENPRSGKVVYTDATGVPTRHWNHRDADRTKVTEDSERIVFLLETVDATAFGATVETATDGLTALLRHRSHSVAVYRITTADPAALVSAGDPARSDLEAAS